MMKKIILLFLSFITLAFSSCPFSNTPSNNQHPKLEITYRINENSAELKDFLTYWNDNFAYLDDICSFNDNSLYTVLKAKFANLNTEEKQYVREYVYNEKDTIGEALEVLDNKFSSKKQTQTTKELDQTTTLVIVVVIACIGMTSICAFYIFKEKNIIS